MAKTNPTLQKNLRQSIQGAVDSSRTTKVIQSAKPSNQFKAANLLGYNAITGQTVLSKGSFNSSSDISRSVGKSVFSNGQSL